MRALVIIKLYSLYFFYIIFLKYFYYYYFFVDLKFNLLITVNTLSLNCRFFSLDFVLLFYWVYHYDWTTDFNSS